MHRTASAAVALALATLTGCSGDPGSVTAATPSASWSFSPPLSSPGSTVTTPSPAPSTASAEVPADYLGSWDMDRAACGTESEGHLTLEPRRIVFYESGGPITRVARAGDGISITATLSGEGTTWVETFTFSLSADGTTLTSSSGGVVRYRCP